MKEQVKQIKEGIKLHVIPTDKFKTNLVAVFITLPLKRENVTKDALLPAVLRRGIKQLTSQEEISKFLENMYGASFDCGVEKTGDNHVLKFYLEALNDSYLPKPENLIKTSIDALLEIVFNPYKENGKFKEDYVNSEKINLKQIIESKIDSKDLYAIVRCTEEMYKGQPYSLYKYGYVEDLEQITAENLYEHYEQVIKNAKIDIFVSGNFSADEVIKLVQENENCNKIQARKAEYHVNNEQTEKKEAKPEQIKEEKMDVAQGKIVIGLDILESDLESRFATVLYNTILGDSANSKLFQNVREKAHLAYSTRSSYIKPKNTIFIRAGIEIENYEKALEIIRQQLEEMKNGNFSEEELENAKKYIISAVDSIAEEQDTEITYYLGQELSASSYTPEEYKQKIEAVSKEQIVQIAGKVSINTIFFLRN